MSPNVTNGSDQQQAGHYPSSSSSGPIRRTKGSSTARNMTNLQVGDRVHAKWGGNGCWYLAAVNAISTSGRRVTVDWDDGDTSDRTVEARDVCKVSDESTPSTEAEIDAISYVDELPGKGRCLFVRNFTKAGGVLFIERPLLVSVPSKYPALWAALSAANEVEPVALGTTTFHFAALLSWLCLNDTDLKKIVDKFAPDEETSTVSRDAERLLELLPPFLNHDGAAAAIGVRPEIVRFTMPTPQYMQALLSAWRYNSFGHHGEEGLVLYHRISMAAHGCDPTCCWTYGDEDSFVLRARVTLEPGAELTLSYLQDDDLLRATNIRRQKLENWKFHCLCNRCLIMVDTCRGFRCLKCRSGAHYYIEHPPDDLKEHVSGPDLEVDSGADVFMSPTNSPTGGSNKNRRSLLTPCEVCGEVCREAEEKQCLDLEPDYIQRIENLDKDNIHDIELVYNASLDFFHDMHWCLFACDQLIWQYYRDRDPVLALMHQEKKVNYHSRAYPRPTFVWAWGLEELADSMQKSPNAFERPSRVAQMMNLYRKAQCQLGILCGPGHPYAIGPQNKWHAAQQKFSELMNK
ncbi:unnamed protein product [Amoebophrya sp. A25]|nr:unnamed protein product [Amoebophrya sp. A25]|eukprot:GSA25T00025593001.1